MRVNVIIILLIIKSIASYAVAPQDTCEGVFQVVVYKGDTVAVDCEHMVLLNAETFAKYYHDSKSLEKLREDIPDWAETIDSLKLAHDENRLELDSINHIKTSQILLERESKQELASDLVESANKNAKLHRQNKFLRLFSAGSSGLCLILLVILL